MKVCATAALLRLRDRDFSYILIDDDDATDAGPLLARLTAEAGSKAKIIVMSDSDRPDDLPYLRKPFDHQALMSRLRP